MSIDAEQKPRVSRITVGRLHNLGNYEHIRYEVEVEIPEGADASLVLDGLTKALNDVRAKGPTEWELGQARTLLAKKAEDLQPHELNSIASARELLRKEEEAERSRAFARQFLNGVGWNVAYQDAKDQWENDGN